jgi:hypothetical protein
MLAPCCRPRRGPNTPLARRTKRAIAMASAMAHDPAASLPAQMQDEAALEAAYRFLQTPDVTYEQLIEPHVQQTRAQAREREQRERESQVWEHSVQAIGTPPEGVQWIHVGDRYSDIFSFLWLCRQQQCDFVV